VEPQDIFNVKIYLPVFYDACYTRYVYGGKNNEIFINTRSDNIKRNLQNENIRLLKNNTTLGVHVLKCES